MNMDIFQVRPKTSFKMLNIEITTILLNTVVEFMQLEFTKQTGGKNPTNMEANSICSSMTKEEIKKYRRKWKQIMVLVFGGCIKSNSKRKVYNDTGQPQETRKSTI